MFDSDQQKTQQATAVDGRRRRTRRIAVGVGGLAVAGAGAVLAAGLGGGESGDLNDAMVQVVPAGTATSTAAPSVTATAAVDSVPVRDGQRPPTDAERIASAKAAAKNSVKIQHPLPQRVGEVPQSALTVQQTGGPRDRQTLRVVSARADLTGQNELAWVADRGQRVGAATCSQRFRFANEAAPATKPTLLVCWRTSATKSVYTVMVNMDGKPSKSKSVAAIAKEWRKLG